MSSYLRLLIVVLAVISIKNYASVNAITATQAQINKQVAELKSFCQDPILCWNWVMVQTCSNDYTPPIVSSPDQSGPTTTARAFAIVHGCMYEAVAAFNPAYKPAFRPRALPNPTDIDKKTAMDAAIAECGYETLFALYPKQRAILEGIRTNYFAQLNKRAKNVASVTAGVQTGKILAAFILLFRTNDNSDLAMPYTPTNAPGYHQPDPVYPNQGFVGSRWGRVKPFFLNTGSQFRAPNIVGTTIAARAKYLNSSRYISNFNESKAFGFRNSTVRTPDQTEIAIAWAYDGAFRVGVPPRAYNQVVRRIALAKKNTLEQNAQFFALINYAMGDASIAAWDTKYFYNFWRPVRGVRGGTGRTPGVRNWLPLGGTTDTRDSPMTPPFPAYVSGHATFGAAVFQACRLFYNTDKATFTWMSDEYNGKAFDSNTGQLRPKKTRRYTSFTQADDENFLSRIYLGVHWRNDQEQGRVIGRSLANFVFDQFIGVNK